MHMSDCIVMLKMATSEVLVNGRYLYACAFENVSHDSYLVKLDVTVLCAVIIEVECRLSLSI